MGVSITLSENNNPFRKVLEAGAAAFKKMFERQSYKPADLFTVPEYKALLYETKAVFDFGIQHHVPESLKSYLDRDVFIFSGLKTHQQLADARSYLKDEKGNIRPYHEFEKRMLKLNPQYNKNYLDAEYSFAVQSAISASNWETFPDNDPDRFVQYRTARDERVRASHAALHNTTLPKEDSFWDSYMPPNGWRCRCRAISVLAAFNPMSNPTKAKAAGEKATTQIGKSGKNKLEMFRFNPGKAKRIFPKNNSYNPKNCEGGKVNLSGLIGNSQIVLSLENERCQAKKLIEDKAGNALYQQREEIKTFARENLMESSIKHTDLKYPVTFNMKGIKEYASQPYKYPSEKINILKNIETVIKNAEYLGASDYKATDMYPLAHILEIDVNNEKSWLVLKESVEKKIIFYSISDSRKIKKKLQKK